LWHNGEGATSTKIANYTGCLLVIVPPASLSRLTSAVVSP
jgi:hypothetical protein